jgi:RNA polymerase sigma-70 factor (ECF subfamily)
MVEDKLLIWRFKRGSRDALRRIYNKYENHLLTLATALLTKVSDAEDAVHDVFVRFAESADNLKVDGSLRSYLATCVVNRARDMIRATHRHKSVSLDEVREPTRGSVDGPDLSAMCDEESRHLQRLLARIPYEQREVIVLHLVSEMTFRQIADLQGASINTVQGRYRYGLDKLRSQLGCEVHDETGK